MTKKYISSQGKTKLLEKAFTENSIPFKYMALGFGNAAKTEDASDFQEVTGNNYSRVIVESLAENQEIKLVGKFPGYNYNPSDGGTITEIAIVDSSTHTDNEQKFAIIEVPEIVKTNKVSLEYTVIVSIL